MNIVMMTNTYAPIVGGLERSIETLTGELRDRGHRVLIVVPQIDKYAPDAEQDVLRVPSITHYRRTDFPVQLPVPSALAAALEAFGPEIIHSHHPFLIGDTALRAAARFGVPLIYTMHTMYEHYTHYMPLDSAALKRFLVYLASGYSNLCDHVLAPSRSVAQLLKRRGVFTPISVVPTGICLRDFGSDRGSAFRRRAGIPPGAFVVGSVGRIAREKNIALLISSVGALMDTCPRAHFLLIGDGPMAGEVADFFARRAMRGRLHAAGPLQGPQLVAAYQAMDVFAFTSLSETQGIVLAEAMAAGVPVVAFDAPGTRDIVKDTVNGRLVPAGESAGFVQALSWARTLSARERSAVRSACARTARRFSSRRSAERVMRIYAGAIARGRRGKENGNGLARMAHLIRAEWSLVLNAAQAAGKAVFPLKRPVLP